MENLEELHSEIEKRSNVKTTHLVVSVLWTVIAEQPLHVQFKLIKQGLDKHKPRKIDNNKKCSLDTNIQKSIKPPPQSHVEHVAPPTLPTPPIKHYKWWCWIVFIILMHL